MYNLDSGHIFFLSVILINDYVLDFNIINLLSPLYGMLVMT